jgi:hypothetical protein
MLRCTFLVTFGLPTSVSSLSAQTAPDPSPPPTSSPAAEQPNSPEPMEEAQLGDRWTYEIRDEITGDVKSTISNTVTDVSNSQISTKLAQLGNFNSGYQTFDRSWDMVENGTWRYTPNDGTGIRTPLTVGKTWPFKATDVNNTASLSIKRTGTSKVVGQESVTTRAGTFETFKIETSYQLQNANDPTKKVQVTQQTWYAPAINHWVKRTFASRSEGRAREKTSVELVEYGRR